MASIPDPDRLEQIKARLAKANPTAWRYDTLRVNRTSWPDDQAFIVHAAEDMGWLLGEVERLGELAELRDQLLACYRLGKQPSGKLLDRLSALRSDA